MVDLLEANADFQLHDHTAFDMAKELREMFGMCDYATEQRLKAEHALLPMGERITFNLPHIYPGDFSQIQIQPDK